MERQNVIKEKSFEFALKIIEFAEILESKRKYIIARQILKSGTSIGANINEAQSAESKPILFINLKSLIKKQLKQNIGCSYVSILKHIRIQKV